MTDTGYSEKCVISTGVQFKAKSANVDVYQYGIHVIIYFFFKMIMLRYFVLVGIFEYQVCNI